MQSDLCSDEDMSFMTYSELQLIIFTIAINHMKNTHNLRKKCMSVAVEGDSFLEETAFSIGLWFLYMSVALPSV